MPSPISAARGPQGDIPLLSGGLAGAGCPQAPAAQVVAAMAPLDPRLAWALLTVSLLAMLMERLSK